MEIIFIKKILARISFLVWLVLGYLLGFFKIHTLLTFLPRISFDPSWLSWLGQITPKPTFLSDVAAFEATIIAFLVPLSIEIISKISERYNADVITRSFDNTWENKILPPFLLINIVAAILLRFFVQDDINSVIWKVLAWIVLLVVMYIAFAIWRVINRIKTFMSDTKSVINQLYEDVEKSIESKKATASKQDVLVQSLEGIGDILVFETKRQKNKLVLDGLKKISDLVRRIFEIQQGDPDRFEQLVVSQDFFELYKKDEKEAKLRLAFDPEKYLISFSTAINQIVRVYEAAIGSQNEEISRFAVYHINWILAALSSQQNNGLFVEQILRKLAEITRTAIQRNDGSAYAAAIHWYTDIVFNRLGRKGDFQLSYLDLFDKYFFSTVRYIVTENQTSIFHSLVSSLVDGIHVPDYHRGEVWNYSHIILNKDLQKYNKLDAEHDIGKRVRELADSENDINTQEKLEAWLKKFDELKTIIEPNLDEDQKKSAQEIEEKIRDFVTSQFKYQNLLEIVFAVGAYCLFKQRYGYIKYLWEYKQPPDSDASWIGHDITPSTLDEVIRLYFRKGFFEKKLDFWEGHHGSEKYYKQYFLLLLARILQSVPADFEGKYSQIENYKLPDLHVYRLSYLEHSIDEFIALSAELKQAGNMLAEIGFDTAKLDEIFDDKLVPFLNKIKGEAEKQISAKHKTGNISQKRIGEFKQEVLKSFYEGANLRDIFAKYFKTYEDKTKEKIAGKKERFGIDIVYDKASFFDAWHVHYVDWGEHYGRDLASGENSFLLDDIAKDCKEITKKDFEAMLAKIENPNDIVIFATKIAFERFFEDSKSFKPKIKQLEIKGFGGCYNFNGQSIPVFKTYHRKIDKQILILNKTKVGRLVQLSPLNDGENEKSIEDIFYMDIQAFSENKDLMEKFIKKPPEWLQKIGDEQKQREHLQERVRIQIFERFEYNKPADFEGYKLTLKDN